MINYSGIEAHESVSVSNLPVGAYVGKIIKAEVETVGSGENAFERLKIAVDVTEGDYKDHFRNQYNASLNGRYPAKWKGVIRYSIPKPGSQYEQGQKKALEHLAFCLEDSNAGYKWNGDETKMAGLAIGFSVREFDWIMDNYGVLDSGTSTEIGRAESVKRVKAGEVKPMRKRELKEKDKERLIQYQEGTGVANENGMMHIEPDEDLPF